MPTFILVIIIQVGSGITSTKVDRYSTIENCQKAGDTSAERMAMDGLNLKYVCVPKEEH